MQPTTLVGRQAELDQVHELLLRPDVRLLTLVGAGGSGKTRLAIAAATELSSAFDASRTALRSRWEHEYPVLPLALPDEN
jgi:predicted ribonuclease YlaK